MEWRIHEMEDQICDLINELKCSTKLIEVLVEKEPHLHAIVDEHYRGWEKEDLLGEIKGGMKCGQKGEKKVGAKKEKKGRK